MDIASIHLFVAVVQHGSFAAVARAQRVAPSSVSRTIADLEGELGVRLFQRTTRRLSLTEAGERYLARVAPLLEELERAQNEARDLSTMPRGTLRVATPSPFAQVHLSRWLPRFLAAEPDIDVELVLDARYTDLVSERIDVAIRLGQVESLEVIARKLRPMPRAVVASPERLAGRTLKPAALAREPCLVFPHETSSDTWKFRDARGNVRQVRPKARVTAPDGIVLRELASKGVGFALLPVWLCAGELATGELVDAFPRHDVTATEFDAGIWVVYPSRAYVPLKVRAFADFIASELGRRAPWS